MANLDNPFGLLPVNKGSSAESGQRTLYYIPSSDSTAVFRGDGVVKTGTATADGVPIVTLVAAGTNPMTGAVDSVQFDPDDLKTTYRKASTGRYVYVADAPDQRFHIQASGAVAATDIGTNANVVFTHSGSTIYGTSGMELDASSFGTGATLQLKVHRLVRTFNNEFGTHSILEVSINNHTEAPNKAGI